MAAWTDALVVGPGEGTIVSGCAGGCVLETKATAADTNGRYAFQEMTVVAGFPRSRRTSTITTMKRCTG